MKKLICILSFILIFSCLVACNNSSDFTSEKQISVTLDLDGGSIDGATSYTFSLWEDVSLPTPAKKGYEFTGWTHNGNFVSLKPWMINEKQVTIKANWKLRNYQVYFDFNGGLLYEGGQEITKNNLEITYGQKVEIKTPERYGYDFDGWYFGEEEVDLSSFNIDVGKVIILAKWKLKKQQVTFDFNGGKQSTSLDTEKIIELEHNQAIPFLTLTKRGYTFGGWQYEDGTPFNLQVWQYDSEISKIVAVWNPISITYDFDLKGGMLDAQSGNILYGSSTQTLRNLIPQKEGYEFVKWKINGAKLNSKFEYLPLKGNSKVILTAEYKPNSYKLTLNAGEGYFSEDVSKTANVEFGVKNTIQVPTAPQGKYFVGYKIEGTDEFVSSSNGSVVWGKTEGATLVAEYSTEQFINFINYDGTISSININDLAGLQEYDFPEPKTKEGYSASWDKSIYDIRELTETAEINAVLTPNTYSVIFKNGYRVVATRSYIYGEEVNLPSGDEVKNDGYDLLGWSLSRDDSSDYMSGTIVWEITRHVELFAVWTNFTYNIVYDTSTIPVEYNLVDQNGDNVTSIQTVTYHKPYKLYSLSAKNNAISVVWLYNGNPFATSGVYEVNGDIVLTPKISLNSVKININLDLNGGSGSMIASIKLGSQFKTISSSIYPPKNKAITGYSYKGQLYLPTDTFSIVDYDGTPIKVIYEDYIYFKIKVDVNGGTGDNFAIIEYGKALGTMDSRPVAPNGKKLVGFEYNGKEYAITYVWDFASYDGGVFKAIYVSDDDSWSPTV